MGKIPARNDVLIMISIDRVAAAIYWNCGPLGNNIEEAFFVSGAQFRFLERNESPDSQRSYLKCFRLHYPEFLLIFLSSRGEIVQVSTGHDEEILTECTTFIELQYFLPSSRVLLRGITFWIPIVDISSIAVGPLEGWLETLRISLSEPFLYHLLHPIVSLCLPYSPDRNNILKYC